MTEWWDEFLLTTPSASHDEQMSLPYSHAEGSNHPHEHQQYHQDPRGRPPPIHIPRNPYEQPLPHHHDQHSYPHQVQQAQGYYPPPPPPNIFYAAEDQPPGPPVNMIMNPPYSSDIQPKLEHEPPSVMMQHMPPSYLEQQQQQQHHQYHQQQQQQSMLISPYEMPLQNGSSHNPAITEYFPNLHTPTGAPMDSGSSHNTTMAEYFPPQLSIAQQPDLSMQSLPLSNQVWQSTIPAPLTTFPNRHNTSAGPSAKPEKSGTKTSRQQFTACGACRHRRVKCDLKDKQEAAEDDNDEDGVGPTRAKDGGKQKKVSCTNCIERGLNCIDEFAPLKAAKQLRRGKRISEIEMLFGKTAASAAVAHRPAKLSSDTSLNIIKGKQKEKEKDMGKEEFMPDLTKEFFDSPFFRRFQVQRPILDPHDFIARYLSISVPSAAAMGPEGAVLCHVLYAWAVSYGVDHYGRLDIPEGGGAPLENINLLSPGDGELQRETDRLKRKEKMRAVIEVILKEIDECGMMRKPTWDGVRVLLLVLPLTDGIASPVERLSMYEAAISQVFTLCSFIGVGYDGQPSGTAGINGGSDDSGGQDLLHVRVRIYWYAFVHEGITTGLKGGRLHLDDEDLETMQDSIDHKSLVRDSAAYKISSRFATSPINLALACRKINKALTGPAAKRRTAVNGDLVKQAWEALERCWEDFDQLKYEASKPAFAQGDEVIRFADGWKIFLFEAQNVIRKNLEDRIEKLSKAQTTAFITESNPSTPEAMHNDLLHAQHLLDISKDKCEVQTRQIMEIVRRHVGTRFFEWDASLVRDGTYYAAMLLAQAGGSDEDIQICIRALNELRWAHAKAWERSADLRKEWQDRAPITEPPSGDNGWESVLSDLAKLSSHNANSQEGISSDTQSRSTQSSHSINYNDGYNHDGTHNNEYNQSTQVTYPNHQLNQHQHQQHQRHQHQHQHVHQHQHQHIHQIQHHHDRISSHNSEPTPSASPFTSPTIISPTYDSTTGMGLPMMRGYIPQSQSQSQNTDQRTVNTMSTLEPIEENMTMTENDISYEKWLNTYTSPNTHTTIIPNSVLHQQDPRLYHNQESYPMFHNHNINNINNYPNHLGPPPLNSIDQHQQAQYVVRQDGSHVLRPL
ncbi:uncharacterized protein IL334_003205 [Kwoniella shivajii]|uniref:Zn(2)-C6 fungal-type domain-containing protein n=1 Tax=Kwoniella shivajii TaxID=564305 RepID=A0ABZ1D108_9TREE|nr:hypothetical protein IL334_003205 [Kwoniella shivajii]